MKRRLTHYLGIGGGRIEIHFAGDLEDAEPHCFDSEDNAVSALAAKIKAIPGARLMTSSLVNHPGEYDRPDFDIEAFMRRLGEAVQNLMAPSARQITKAEVQRLKAQGLAEVNDGLIERLMLSAKAIREETAGGDHVAACRMDEAVTLIWALRDAIQLLQGQDFRLQDDANGAEIRRRVLRALEKTKDRRIDGLAAS